MLESYQSLNTVLFSKFGSFFIRIKGTHCTQHTDQLEYVFRSFKFAEAKGHYSGSIQVNFSILVASFFRCLWERLLPGASFLSSPHSTPRALKTASSALW